VNVRALFFVVVLLGASTSCTTRGDDALSPTRSTKGSTTTNDTSTSPTVELLPPRARELDLSDVDPCTGLLTDEQLRELGYDLGYARPPKAESSREYDGPTCTFSSTNLSGGKSRNILTLVGISTADGVSSITVSSSQPEVMRIADFSALVLPNPSLPDSCLVVVDNAEGQFLEVSSGPITSPGSGLTPYCDEAERVALMAIRTISESK
jgi:hypothetical protein